MTPSTSAPDRKVDTATVWAEAWKVLDGNPSTFLNLGYEAVDRHAKGELKNRVAIRWLGRGGERIEFTYGQLSDQTSRYVDVLTSLGIGRGERVFALSSRLPELYVAALGTLMAGAVFCPLFSAFGPDPIHQRMEIGEAAVLVTTGALYRRKVAPIVARLPNLRHVLFINGDTDTDTDIDEGAASSTGPAFHDLRQLLREATATEVATTTAEDPALLHFTSGTTGKPKGALHVHAAAVVHAFTGRTALDLRDGDVFWCTADPGWVTGTSYGILAPLLNGVTMVVDEADFDADRWYRIIQDEQVTVWYTAPTAVRMLMRIGLDVAAGYDLSSLRFVGSVGEPLSAEGVRWGEEAFGQYIHDNWWQTETGGIMIANSPGHAIKPGSMGLPIAGIEATVLQRDDDGELLVDSSGEAIACSTNDVGELALRAGWPSMFRTYIHEQERYDKCFVGPWYRTGDLARCDEDGYFWFVGRGDDVIKSAGHLIGPFEVESVLTEHPSVAEAGVIGVPDEAAGHRVKAFVSLATGVTWDEDLSRDLRKFARQRLGAAVAPREIEWRQNLPKTRSGKIMRRLLKAEELGLPIGDLSTLEKVEQIASDEPERPQPEAQVGKS